MVVTDDVMIAIASKMIKERKDSASQYRAAERADLADKEEAEISVISEFLPAQLSAEELNAKIVEVIAQTGAADVKDLGKVMTAIKPIVQGRTDMGKLSQIVRAMLAD